MGFGRVVGSTNFDNRSFGINDEVNLAVCDRGVRGAAGARHGRRSRAEPPRFARRMAAPAGDRARTGTARVDLRAAAVMPGVTRFRVATYNIHKCRGFDRRTSPERINAVIEELQAEIVCLQEVVDAPEGPRIFDQAREIARAFPEYSWCFGSNRALRGGNYGNMTLTRFPIRSWRNHDLTHRKREERGVLQVDIEIGAEPGAPRIQYPSWYELYGAAFSGCSPLEPRRAWAGGA